MTALSTASLWIAAVAFTAPWEGVSALDRSRVDYEPIAGYKPLSLVTSHNALDLDQREFMVQTKLGTLEGYEAAMKIYSQGAFTEPMAFLNLTLPLQEALEIGDEVIGYSQGAVREVTGRIVNNYPRGTHRIRVMYDVNPVQSSFVGCQVAANPQPNLDGCFGNDGILVITGFHRSFSYTYDPLTDNVSNRFLERLSTGARVQMELCMNCPYDDYLKFREYYGAGDYAHKWVKAALEGRQTDFPHGNANFQPYGEDGKYEAMTKGTAFMTIWMYVIRQMEAALDECEFQQSADSGVHAWDEAVAFYVGSLAGKDGAGEGVLTYSLADERCTDFRSCGDVSNSALGTSYVNLRIMQEFSSGQEKLAVGYCDGARKTKESIVKLMRIPLIQSTLRWAYYQSTGEITTEKAEAEGATFAATILPFIHACGNGGQEDAAIIYENMKTGHGPVDFVQVKKAFERNYECLNIVCAEVGGIWDDDTQSYREGAMPCKGSTPDEEESYINAGLAVGLALASMFLLICIVALTSCLGRKPAPEPFIPSPSEII